MIVVTPYIVHAIDPNQIVRPDQNFSGRQRSANLVPRPRQPHLFHVGIPSTDARLRRQGRIHYRVGLAAFRPDSLQSSRRKLMAALPDARCVFVRVLSLGFAAAAAVALNGCGVNYASTAPAFRLFSGAASDRCRSAPTSLEIFTAHGALDARSIENIRAFAERYRHYGSGDITILAPAGTSAIGGRSRGRRALARAGVNGRILFGTYASPEKGAAAPIWLVSFIGSQGDRPTAGNGRGLAIGRRVEERAYRTLGAPANR